MTRTNTPFREGWDWPKSSVPTADSIADAETVLDAAKWRYETIGRAARKHVKGILSGIIAESAINDIPSKTRNPRHQVMMLASIFTQYDIYS